MSNGGLSIDDFAASIKEAYPQYKDADNYELATEVLKKHPVYASQIASQPSLPKPPSPFGAGGSWPAPGSPYIESAEANPLAAARRETLGREVGAAGQTLAAIPGAVGRVAASPFRDVPMTDEERKYGFTPNVGPAGRFGQEIGRQVGIPIGQAAEWWKRNLSDPGLRSNLPDAALSVLPEALGTGAGTVLGGKVGEAALDVPPAIRASRMLPSINRAKAAFRHLDTGLADVNAADPGFAPHVERISGTAQDVATRFSTTKLKSTPPIVDKLIERTTDPANPISWPELRQFKTDLNTLIWDREIPSQFKGPLKNLVKDVDQGLRAGADLRGQGDVFSKANTDFRRSIRMQQTAESVGPYVGAGLGAGAGALAGEAVGHPWPGYWAGKVAGYKTGGPLAGALVRSITERTVPPEQFPPISPSRTTAAPAVPSAGPTPSAAMPEISPSRVVSRSSALAAAKGAPSADVASALTNLGVDKKVANLAASTAARDNPGADFNTLFKDALAKSRGSMPETTQTQVQPSTREILNRLGTAGEPSKGGYSSDKVISRGVTYEHRGGQFFRDGKLLETGEDIADAIDALESQPHQKVIEGAVPSSRSQSATSKAEQLTRRKEGK